ncbi:MAG: alanyl-tRNA editing protein [Treponema sp.]|jgi:alanyl-tRNA synthetase|nr:alanyl-tRNA editing protein [Treponema sp.]
MAVQRDYYDVDLYGGGVYQARLVERRPHNGGAAVILDRTVFYPEGGGQPGDRGTINGRNLIDVKEEGGEILHIVGEGDGLVPGPVELVLDLPRRRDFTVQHSAQHLLSGTILRITGFPTVSMHLGEVYNTIDVDGKDLSRETLMRAEDEAAQAIEEDVPLIIHHCPPERVEDFPLRKTPPRGEEVIRVVEIRGRDFSPCCGTHVKSAGQLGALRILGAEKYKGMTRITFIAGGRCLREARVLRENAETISRALKVPVEETGRAALALLERTAALEERLKAYEEEAARTQARSIIEEAELAEAGPGTWHVRFFPGAGMEEVTRLGRHLRELSGAVFVLGAERDAKFAALCSTRNTDLRPRLKEALEKAAASGGSGRGGGGPDFFQGQFASAEELKAFLAEL